MAKPLTNDIFITRAKSVYNDKYDYSKTNYINSDTNIVITCPKHGDFEKRPLKFLNGTECGECKKEDSKNFGTSKKLNTKEFINKSKEIFGDKYDYSETSYVNYRTKLVITCKKHGNFEVIPNYHLSNKSGCQKCAKDIIIQKNTISKDEFIKRAVNIHGDKYDYSKIKYHNLTSKIELFCKKHGYFEVNAIHHIHSNVGCQKCGHEIGFSKIKDTLDDFISKANNKHKNKYNYSLVNYINSTTKVKIKCDKHGIFEQMPSMHISGQGCPICKESYGEREIRNWLESNNITFEYQKKFDGCKNKRKLPFDFYLPEHNICIEFNGSQHYKISTYFGEESFNKTQINDKIKEKFCKENNIKLIIIKYNDVIEVILNQIL